MIRSLPPGAGLQQIAAHRFPPARQQRAMAGASPIIWSVEIAQLLFVWRCALSADLALQGSRHWGLPALHELIGPHWRRLQPAGDGGGVGLRHV